MSAISSEDNWESIAAIDRVVERMNGREAEACNRIFSNRNLTRATRLQYSCKFLLHYEFLPGYSSSVLQE